jgi:hypothetical protein
MPRKLGTSLGTGPSQARGGSLQGGHRAGLGTGPSELGPSLGTGPGWARAAAVLSVCCGLLHARLLTGAPVGWPGAVHAAVLLACVPCAVHLWRRPGRRAWGAHVLVTALMVGQHPLSVALAPGTGGHLHAPAGWAVALAPLTAVLALGAAGLAGLHRWMLAGDGQISGTAASEDSARRVPHA